MSGRRELVHARNIDLVHYSILMTALVSFLQQCTMERSRSLSQQSLFMSRVSHNATNTTTDLAQSPITTWQTLDQIQHSLIRHSFGSDQIIST